jgi:hypothetical protein
MHDSIVGGTVTLRRNGSFPYWPSSAGPSDGGLWSSDPALEVRSVSGKAQVGEGLGGETPVTICGSHPQAQVHTRLEAGATALKPDQSFLKRGSWQGFPSLCCL